jgi:predicted dehydrogenase
MAKRLTGKTIRSAVVGYGPACNMGKLHATYMNDNPRFDLVAVCDINPVRADEAKKDFPQIDTYTSLAEMLRRDDLDLVSVVVPHNVHAKVVLQCLRAGKHAIVEKPMCLTVAEGRQMIAEAKRRGLMFTCFQNRRLDGDFLAIREVIESGLIGDVFHIETYGGGYHRPGSSWRSEKKIVGGPLYDWGAHFVDWVLNLVPSKVADVTGFFHKLVWHEVTNEDQGRAIVRFANGAVADIQLSNIAMIGKARWRILGTQGAITDGPNNSLKVMTLVQGRQAEITVPYKPTKWEEYYVHIADHLLRGRPLLVKPEESLRAIAVIEGAERSAKAKKPVAPAVA